LLLCCAATDSTFTTLEHVVPRTRGATDDLDDLAITGQRDNSGRGHRLDEWSADDQTLRRVIATRETRRQTRPRPPPKSLDLPPIWRTGPPDAF
jgi:hypothetical protein